MNTSNFQFSFKTQASPNEVFAHLCNPKNWWVGLFGETIDGESAKINDEFSFKAGDGIHYSNQKLVEIDTNKKIVWMVTDSNLSFLQNTNEWNGTKICFDIEQESNNTTVTFTHYGLVPDIECYSSCSNAWTQYLQNLHKYFN